MAGNLYHALLRAAAGAGDRLFLDTGDARSIAYSELDRRVAAVASALLSAGIKPGDRVPAQVEQSSEAVLLYLASLRTGAIFMPLNSAYTSAELSGFVDDSETTLLVSDPKQEGTVQGIGHPHLK